MRAGIIYQQAPLVPLTDEIASGLWPTPVDGSKGGGSSPSADRIDETPTLQGMARKGLLERWPTPPSRDYKDGSYCPNVEVNGLLGRAVWPTPTSNDYKNAGYQTANGKDFLTLPGAVGAAPPRGGWPTPQARDSHNRSGQAHRYLDEKRWNLQDCLEARGNGGSLNPTWVEWLMGFPSGWTDLGASATQSFLKSRNGSAAD